MINNLILCTALICGYSALIYIAYSLFSFAKGGCGKFAPFFPSYGCIKDDLLKEAATILADSKKSLTVADLGSGNGKLLLPLAAQFPQHKFVGYEWDWLPYTWAKIRGKNYKNLVFLRENFMKHNFKDTDVLLCYGLKSMMKPLGDKLINELRPGSYFLSEIYPITEVTIHKTVQTSMWGVPCKLYIHKQSAKKK